MELVGLSEVAEIAGVSRQAVVNWRARFSDFPRPVAELASGPVWHREEIEKWLKTREGNMENVITKINNKKDNKQETHESDLRDFDRVEVSSAIQAEITRTDDFSVKVVADSYTQNRIDIHKIGNTLKIRLKPSIFFHHINGQVMIGMPQLRGIRASGATDVTVRGFNSADELDIEANGASSIRMKGIIAGETSMTASGASNINGDVVMADGRLQTSGASKINLRGNGGTVKLEASGASSIDLGEFKAKDADVRLSGASSASVTLKGKLDASLSGASKLIYDGEVVMGKIQVTGASTLKQG